MKVYIFVETYDNDYGFQETEVNGAFSSREKALKYAEKQKIEREYENCQWEENTDFEILELTIQ